MVWYSDKNPKTHGYTSGDNFYIIANKSVDGKSVLVISEGIYIELEHIVFFKCKNPGICIYLEELICYAKIPTKLDLFHSAKESFYNDENILSLLGDDERLKVDFPFYFSND